MFMAWFHKYNMSEQTINALQEIEKEAQIVENEDKSDLSSLTNDIQSLELLKKRMDEIITFVRTMKNQNVNRKWFIQKNFPNIRRTIAYLRDAAYKINQHEEKAKKDESTGLELSAHIIELLNETNNILQKAETMSNDQEMFS